MPVAPVAPRAPRIAPYGLRYDAGFPARVSPYDGVEQNTNMTNLVGCLMNPLLHPWGGIHALQPWRIAKSCLHCCFEARQAIPLVRPHVRSEPRALSVN